MAVENIPWGVQGGLHSAALMRVVANQALGNAEGVAAIGDCIVRALAIPGTKIRVGSGAVALTSRYPGVKNESYVGRVISDTEVDVPANNTSSVRYDMVIAYIDDWNFAGQQATPAGLPTSTTPVLKLKVITGVNSTYRYAYQLNLPYPAVALARIGVPANTATITQAMIVADLREKVNPRQRRSLFTLGLGNSLDENLEATAQTGEGFPDQLFTVTVPEWATRVRVVGQWTQVMVAANAANGSGNLWVKLGIDESVPLETKRARYDTVVSGGTNRATYAVADDIAIPAALRGKSIRCAMAGRKDVGTPTVLYLNGGSAVVLDLEFVEIADGV